MPAWFPPPRCSRPFCWARPPAAAPRARWKARSPRPRARPSSIEINYTRTQESEADRIGIDTMASAGYDPLGMASFFDELSRNGPNPEPDPGHRIPARPPGDVGPRRRGAQPRRRRSAASTTTDSLSYGLMRERLRSLVGDPHAAVNITRICSTTAAVRTSTIVRPRGRATSMRKNPAAGDRRSEGAAAANIRGHATLRRLGPGLSRERPD